MGIHEYLMQNYNLNTEERNYNLNTEEKNLFDFRFIFRKR